MLPQLVLESYIFKLFFGLGFRSTRYGVDEVRF